jgi:hypothetical protein
VTTTSANVAEREHAEPAELLHESLVMVLYISIALLGALVALPDHDLPDDPGPHGWPLVGLIWGTAIGLALAHWFAFDVVARVLADGRRKLANVELGAVQLAGAATVALLTSLPILVTSDAADQEAATWVPTIIIGVAGFFVARRAGRGRARSVLTGVGITMVGTMIAIVKIELVGH